MIFHRIALAWRALRAALKGRDLFTEKAIIEQQCVDLHHMLRNYQRKAYSPLRKVRVFSLYEDFDALDAVRFRVKATCFEVPEGFMDPLPDESLNVDVMLERFLVRDMDAKTFAQVVDSRLTRAGADLGVELVKRCRRVR